MNLPPACLEKKHELLKLLQDILARLPDNEEHKEIRARIEAFTKAGCPGTKNE